MSTQALLDFVYGDTRRGVVRIGREAAAIAARALGRARFTIAVEDVVQDVVIRIIESREREPDRAPIDNPAAYFTTACQRYCINLSRADRRLSVTGDDELVDRLPAPSMSPAANPVEQLDMARAVIEALGTAPIPVSGALTWLSLAYDSDIDLEGVPRPRAGVAADQVAGWPALWFATRRPGLFGAGAAASRRRQRAINEIARLRGRATLQMRTVMRS